MSPTLTSLPTPGMGNEDDIGIGAGGDGRQCPAGPRWEQIGHVPGARGKILAARLFQPPDAPVPAPGGPVAALGKITSAPSRSEPTGQPLDLLDEELPAGPAVVNEHVGKAVGHDIETRIKLHRRLHDDAWPPPVHAEQMAHEQERIARARMAAEHDDRAGQAGCLLIGGELWLVDLDPHPECRGSPAVDEVKEPAHDRVVAALERLRMQPPAETARRHSPRHMNSVAVSAVSQTSAKNSSRTPRMRPGGDSPTRPNIRARRASSGNSTSTATAIAIASGASTSRRISLGGSMRPLPSPVAG